MATEHIPTPSLQEQLDSLQAQDATETALELEARMQRDLEVLSRSGITQHSLQVGEQAPGFTLPDALGQPVTLSEFLKQGPVVVTFYRGEWCPNCDLQLLHTSGYSRKYRHWGPPSSPSRHRCPIIRSPLPRRKHSPSRS
jgi:AhpC/TSA family